MKTEAEVLRAVELMKEGLRNAIDLGEADIEMAMCVSSAQSALHWAIGKEDDGGIFANMLAELEENRKVMVN